LNVRLRHMRQKCRGGMDEKARASYVPRQTLHESFQKQLIPKD